MQKLKTFFGYDVSDMEKTRKGKKTKQMAVRLSEADKAVYEKFSAERGYDSPSDWLRALAASDFEAGDSLAAKEIKDALFRKLMSQGDPMGTMADFMKLRKDQVERQFGDALKYLGSLRSSQEKRRAS